MDYLRKEASFNGGTRHTLAVEVDEAELDTENFPETDDIVSVCARLVTVDGEGNIILLAHHTAQEYLRERKNVGF